MKQQNTWDIVKRLFLIGMKFRSWFIFTLIISIFLAIVSTYRPILTKNVVDIDIVKLKDKAQLMKHIYLLIGLVIAETVLNFFLVYFSNFISPAPARIPSRGSLVAPAPARTMSLS